MKRIAWGLSAVLLSGCSLLDGWVDRGEPRRVEEISRAGNCGGSGGDAWVKAFPGPEALRAWQGQAGLFMPGMDTLHAGGYVLIGMGQRNSGGYGLAVSREATERDGVLRLQATFLVPSAGRMVTQMITSPCVLVRVPASGWRAVEVVDQDGLLRARGGIEG
ncbi:MAG TPA: protease complex subunit PrcB family protein [Solimonas sp.]|nr:protease complex subunit PrcB family protein [Solimonas sp.]